MRKKLFGKLLSVALSATMAVTSAVPAYAAVDDAALTGEETESSSGNEAEDVNENPEAAEETGVDAESDPVVGEVPGDAQEEEAPLEEKPAEDALEEASNGVASEEVEEETVAEEGAVLSEAEEATQLMEYADTTVTFTNSQDNVALYYYDESADTLAALSGEKKMNSKNDNAFTFYIAPHTGYTLAADNELLDVGGSYTKGDTGSTTTLNFTKDEISVSDLSNAEKSYATGTINKTGANEVGAYVWSEARKVTIKGGSNSFISDYLDALADTDNHGSGWVDLNGITIKTEASDATADTYNMNVYTYAGTEFTRVNMQALSVTYDSASGDHNVYNAMTDWNNYKAEIWAIKIDSETGKKVKDTSGTSALALVEAEGYNNNAAKYYFLDGNNSKTLKMNSKAVNAGYNYIKENASSDGELAVVISRTTPDAATYTITFESNNFVTFNNNDTKISAPVTDWDGTTFNIANASESGYEITPTSSGTGTLANKRTINKVYYQFEGEEKKEATFNSDHWVIKAGTKNVTISADTKETVNFTEVKYDESAKISVSDVEMNNGTGSETIDTNGNISFDVHSVAGYEVGDIYYWAYTTDGTGYRVQESKLGTGSGTYKISGIVGYVDVRISTKKLESLLGVKTAENYSTIATIKDYRTNDNITKEITEAKKQNFAEANKEYSFTVTAKTGYAIKEVTASADSTNLPVTKSTTVNGLYTLAAPAAGPIVITVTADAKIDVVKVANTYATVTLNDTVLADGETVQFNKDKMFEFVVAGNGATIDHVYYSEASGLAPGTDVGTNPNELHELTLANGKYTIDNNKISEYDGAMYIYVATSRNAVEGTDFSVKFEDATSNTHKDVTTGISIYAGSTDETVNPEAERTITATFTIGETTQTVTTFTMDSESKHELDSKVNVLATVSDNVISPGTEYYGGTAAEVRDKLIAEYTDSTTFNKVKYTAEMPVDILPLKSFVGSYDGLKLAASATRTDGSAGDELRNGSDDRTSLQVKYYKGTTEAIDNLDKTIKEVEYTITPPETNVVMSSSDMTYTKTATGSAKTSVDGDEGITISGAKKVQTLTINAEVTFKDDTTTTLSRDIKVVENVLGYFAIPTTTVNGVTTVNGPNAIKLEVGTGNTSNVNTATVTYNVYKALDATGKNYLTNAASLDSAAIESAKTQNHIADATASELSLTYNDAGDSEFFTINGSSASYTITAKAKTAAKSLTFTGKVGSYTIKNPTSLTVQVSNIIPRYDVEVAIADGNGETGYTTPQFTTEYLSTLNYKKEEVKESSKITAYHLTDVPEGTVLVLPDVSAFESATIDPKRSLAGWGISYDNGSTWKYVTGNGNGVTDAITNATTENSVKIKAVWANKYDNVKALDADLVMDSDANVLTNAALAGSAMGAGTSIPVTIGYKKLLTTTAPSGDNSGAYDEAATVLPQADVAENITITSDKAANSAFTFANGTVTAGENGTSMSEAFTIKWKDGEAEYTLNPISGFSINATANTWEFAMDEVEVEVGQTVTLPIKTFKLNNVNTTLATTNKTANYKIAPTIVSADTSVFTVKEAANDNGDNKLTFEGVGVGRKIATFSFTDKLGAKKEFTITVNVVEAKYNIVAKLTQAYPANALNAPEAEVLGKNDTAALVYGGANTIELSIDNIQDYPGTVTFSSVSAENTKFAVTNGGTSTITITPGSGNLASSTITVTATMTPNETTMTQGMAVTTYVREIPVISYGLVKVYGPLESGKMREPNAEKNGWSDTSLVQKNAFKAYTSSNKATKIEVGKVAVIPVYYDADSETANSYTVNGLASYTAEWIDTTLAQTFLGWGVDKASEKVSTAKALAGEALTLTGTEATGIDLYAYFKESAITLVGGYNKVIDLSDAKIGTTDRGDVEVRISPAASADTIGVYADKTGIIDIKTTSSTTVVDGSNIGSTFDPGTGAWNGGTIVSANKASTGNRTTAYSPDSFFIGKLTNKAQSTYKGVGKVTLSLTNNGEILDTITVYANGEYEEGGKTYYMYRGEVQKNYSAVVDPSDANGDEEIHYYGADGALVENGPFYVESDGRWVLIKNNAKVETVGKNVVSGKTYYVDGDGYIMTDLFKGLISAGTNADVNETYYADPSEDPYLVNSKLVEVDGVSYYFDNNEHMVKASTSANEYEPIKDTDYYVNKNGEIAKGGIFKVENVDRLFRDNYKIVSYTDSDVDPDNHTIDVGNTTYVISEDKDKAEEDKLFEKESAVWAWTKASDGKTYASATVTFTSKEGKTKELTVLSTETDETAAKYMKITPYDGYTEYTVYASFKSKDTTVDATETKYLDADGNDYTPDIYYDPVVAWGPFPTTVKKTDLQAGVYPTVKYSVTYQKASGGEETIENLVATITTSPDKAEITDKITKVTLKATADLSKYFKDAEGKEVAENDEAKWVYLFGTSDDSATTEDISDGKGIYISGLEPEYDYTGNAIQPVFDVIDASGSENLYLAKGVDYTVTYKNNKNVTTDTVKATIVVKGKGNYTGQSATATFDIKDPSAYVDDDSAVLTGATLKLPSGAKYYYTGEEVRPTSLTLKLKGDSEVVYTADDGVYYDDKGNEIPAIVTFSNNINKGTATVLLTGNKGTNGKYTTLKKTYSIKAADINDGIEFSAVSPVDWAVKGAVPEIEISWKGMGLIEGQDYKLSFANNKKIAKATITVTGKGNFSGTFKNSETEKFTVEQFDLEDATFASANVYANIKAGSVKATLLDRYGDVIPASKYTIAVYPSGEESALATSAKLEAGKEYTVTAVAKKTNNIEIKGEISKNVVVSTNKFSSAKVTLTKGYTETYTGEPIYVENEDFSTEDKISNITVTYKINGKWVTLTEGEDFEIAGHTNNVKKGKMTVTLRGLDNTDDGSGFSGTKTFKVTIAAKSMHD